MNAEHRPQSGNIEDRVRYLLRMHLGAWGYGFEGEIASAKPMVESTVFEQLAALEEYARWRDEGGTTAPMDKEDAARLAKGLETELAAMPNTAEPIIAYCRRRKTRGSWLQLSGAVIFALSCAYLYKHPADDLAILFIAAGGTFAALIGWTLRKDGDEKLRGAELGFTERVN